MDTGDYMARDRLIIRVSNALRSAGNVIVLLEKPVREKVATLVNKVDEFNSVIELTDPGQREQARINNRLKEELADMLTLGGDISTGLREILTREP
jgi:hypothetical protein